MRRTATLRCFRLDAGKTSCPAVERLPALLPPYFCPMRILHVLSAEFYAGSVAYAVQLAEAHRAAGHAVWLLSDAPTPLPTGAT